MNRPQPEESAIFYRTYINKTKDDVLHELEEQAFTFPDLLRNLPAEKGDFAYAEGKWTIKEMTGHVIDTERIFVYRALRIARKDKTPLAGFEQNDYARHSRYHERSLESLADEFELLRKANLFLFRSFTEEELSQAGNASTYDITVRAMLFVIAGHVNHHRGILEERYLR
ncbi:DinB family protein [Hufsiella ginkgonis]|uniref:DUF664 domain-containing protein n=1 Tax=Hufsiella ginkgonis TaxID=2695274 RepID=A0A7K1XV58_9SPHI|nr:DinB family protein [Hufsiella ginkgonis]MXV14860.1 DUF664 domain-containing protein [Hufsiella ginkgonis]